MSPYRRPDDGELLAALPSLSSGRLARKLSPYSSTAPVEYVTLSGGGRKLELVFKDLSPGARLDAARRIRPPFVENPLREIAVYRDVLADADLGTAAFHGAVADRLHGRYWLFTERVRGRHLWQSGSMADWCAAARWIARLHASSNPPRMKRDAQAVLLRYDGRFYRAWMKRAATFLRGAPAKARRLERLASRYDAVVKTLAGLPSCFIHGEFYPSNVILRSGVGYLRVCPIDWEMAAIAPGAMDLAALVSGDWPQEQRARMIRAYREESGEGASIRDLAEAVDWCRLHLAVQMLGWSGAWKAPRMHRRNWLDTALHLAEEVGAL